MVFTITRSLFSTECMYVVMASRVYSWASRVMTTHRSDRNTGQTTQNDVTVLRVSKSTMDDYYWTQCLNA